VIGGVGSIPGCLFGGLFVLFVPNIAESISIGLGRDLRRHPADRDFRHAVGRRRFRTPGSRSSRTHCGGRDQTQLNRKP
jgi:hypothetical protein